MNTERRCITVRGLVQGVGFRPYVHELARRLSLSGFVRNGTSGVDIEVEGEPARLRRFLEELSRQPPAAARIDELRSSPAPVRGEIEFRIATSDDTSTELPLFTADRATCEDCRRELFEPTDRRFGYPFLNCTQCGPRLTIIEGAPYDRERTTMARFQMCRLCREEYESPGSRRFHAQPNACPQCGPRLDGPLQGFVDAVLGGHLGALKGIGGYHLVCDATSDAAVARLRQRKARDEKPFAIMVPDLECAAELAHVCELESELLSSPRRPIVILRKRSGSVLASGVSPGNPNVGLMLPYTPLHMLLMQRVEGRPLVMTSANRSDEPIVHLEADLPLLDGIPDIVLGHDRPIRVRCDDSVTRLVLDEELPVRRSRGYAPEPIRLTKPLARRILAVGGHLKNTFALGAADRVIVSHHIGDLDELRALDALERDIKLYEELFDFTPEMLVHDLHPEYASTRYARTRAAQESLPAFAVQHHHAHVAACKAENGLEGPVIGVAFDGSGFGSDGTLWGGEFLVVDEAGFERAAHLRAVPLPGGDRAAREPWRMAISHLVDAGIEPPADENPTIVEMIQKKIHSPLTSSAGRLFDAISSLIGLRRLSSYEGQAARELEWLCDRRLSEPPYPFALDAASGIVDTRPLIRAVMEDRRRSVAPEEIARRFHRTMVRIVVDVCEKLREARGLSRVLLTGGVFQNVLLLEATVPALASQGFEVFRHRLVPPNDGGLSLGQVVVASEQLVCA
ncbi:MAG TPA: carbamoyltransferase HypF [Vicinamibacteria bacterium]|nr:carbamoyltransferase HypF [Vicinamibacteria bacterium]